MRKTGPVSREERSITEALIPFPARLTSLT